MRIILYTLLLVAMSLLILVGGYVFRNVKHIQNRNIAQVTDNISYDIEKGNVEDICFSLSSYDLESVYIYSKADAKYAKCNASMVKDVIIVSNDIVALMDIANKRYGNLLTLLYYIGDKPFFISRQKRGYVIIIKLRQ